MGGCKGVYPRGHLPGEGRDGKVWPRAAARPLHSAASPGKAAAGKDSPASFDKTFVIMVLFG